MSTQTTAYMRRPRQKIYLLFARAHAKNARTREYNKIQERSRSAAGAQQEGGSLAKANTHIQNKYMLSKFNAY